jgi:hypothetical protein
MPSRRTTVERRDYPCWAIVEPAPDIQGKWVAHCLEFDTLAQADDPENAVALLLHSTSEIVLEDLRAGMDPHDRRTPQEDEGWALLEFISAAPKSMRFDTYREMQEKIAEASGHPRDIVIAVQFFLTYQRSVESARLSPQKAHPSFFQARERNVSLAV